MHRFDQYAARTLGLAPTDIRCINALENGPRSPSDLARELGLTRGAMTSLLDRLQELNFIERLRVDGDRRKQHVRLLPAAYQRAGAIYGRLGGSIGNRFHDISPRKAAELQIALMRLAEAFDEAAIQG